MLYPCHEMYVAQHEGISHLVNIGNSWEVKSISDKDPSDVGNKNLQEYVLLLHFTIIEGDKRKNCRKVIAESVARDNKTYTEHFLGKSNREYQTWIQNSSSWGGAIELSILSR